MTATTSLKRLMGSALVVLSMLTACSGGNTPDRSSSKPLKTYHFAIISPQVQPAILNHWIGKYLGYFADEGIDADIQTSQGVTDALQKLVIGNLDVTIGSLETLYGGQATGAVTPVKLYYQYQLISAYAMAVAQDSNITSVAQLKGKSIGVISFAETGYFYGKNMVKAAGLNPDTDVTFEVLGGGPALLNALQTGKIAAMSTFTSQYAIFHTQGYDVKRLTPPDPRVAAIGNVGLQARDDQLSNPEARKMLVGWARAVTKATIFGIANPDAACRIHFEMYPQTVTAGKSYAQNLADCKFIWEDRMGQYDARQAGLSKWGLFEPEKLKLFAEVIGIKNVDVNKVYTNDLIDDINKGVDEKAVVQQAKSFCEGSAHQDLCSKR